MWDTHSGDKTLSRILNSPAHLENGFIPHTECESGTTTRDKAGSSFQQRTSTGTCFYVSVTGYNRTRSGKYHVRSWESDGSPDGCLISVKSVTETKVLLRNTGPTMVVPQPDTHSFWEFLDSRGGEWMWESMSRGKGLKWT